MSIHIRSEEADRLVQELEAATGKPAAEIVLDLLRAERARLATAAPVQNEEERIRRALEATREIQRLWRESPVIDPRTPDEILGYDENGLPG